MKKIYIFPVSLFLNIIYINQSYISEMTFNTIIPSLVLIALYKSNEVDDFSWFLSQILHGIKTPKRFIKIQDLMFQRRLLSSAVIGSDK